jgi:hypothetical protein
MLVLNQCGGTRHPSKPETFCASATALLGRVIAQAVSRRFPTAAARIRGRIRLCGIYGGQSGNGAGFLRVLWFPLSILIPSTAPHSSSVIRGWYSRPVSGRRAKWTQFHPPQETKKILLYYKQTVTVTVPLPSAYCSTGSESHSHHRCFL